MARLHAYVNWAPSIKHTIWSLQTVVKGQLNAKTCIEFGKMEKKMKKLTLIGG